jgi:ATP-dependent Clp protease ATP-binding subunit ClpX
MEDQLRQGIRVPALTRDAEEDEYPGQQRTDARTAGTERERDVRDEGAVWGMPDPAQVMRRPREQERIPPQPETMHYSPHPQPQGQQPPPLFDPTPLTLEKSNILLLGPSGVGKTLMAKTLARVLDVPFSMSDCTPFTQAGYIGEDAEVCIQRLLAAANYDIKAAERGIICLDELDKLARREVGGGMGRDVGGEGVQQALLKIVEGTTVSVQAKAERGSGPPHSSRGAQQGYPPPGGNPISGGQQGGSQGMQKGETFNVKTDNILFICAGAFNGLHKMVLDRISKGSIGFGATVRAAPGTSNSPNSNPHETILEGEDELFEKHLPYYQPPPPPAPANSTQKPKRQLNTLDLVTPSDLQKYGLIPELVGRLPVSCALSSLSIDALVKVLTEPRNSLLKQYEQLFSLSQIELRFTSPALRVVAETAASMGTGARGLRTVMERLLSDAMFETPGSGTKYILVTEEVAKLKAAPVYLRRGEQGRFHHLIAEEEEAWEEKRRREESGGESEFERRARVNSEGGAARTFEEYREKVAGAGF